MDIRKLQRAIVDGLEDVKGQHIAVFNTEHLSAMFERVIIATGASNRQTKALAASVRDSVKSRGMQVMSTEGEENGEWIIVDCGAAVVHLMQPAIRDYYHLEEIWGGKSVRLKAGEGGRAGLVKAGESDATGRRGAAKAAASKPAARKTASKKAPVRPFKSDATTVTSGSHTANTVAGKTALTRQVAGNPPASRTAAVKQPATRGAKIAAKGPLAKTTVAKTTVAKTPFAKTPPANTPAARKAAANKSAAYKRVGAKRPTGAAASSPRPSASPATKKVARKTPRAS